jgi:hypothetical protein
MAIKSLQGRPQYPFAKGEAMFPHFLQKGGLGGISMLTGESIYSNSAPYPTITKPLRPLRLCGELLFI